MNHPKRPLIISLGERLQPNICSRGGLEFRNGSELVTRNQNDVFMTSELDPELRNDFQWLIDFNLRSVFANYLDEEPTAEDETPKKRTRFRKKENAADEGGFENRLRGEPMLHSGALADVVELCLSEKSEATVKSIFKWIRERYPCFKPNDTRWKKSVRLELMNNPAFKAKASKRGKNSIWYLAGRNPDCLKSHPQGIPWKHHNAGKSQDYKISPASSRMNSPLKEYIHESSVISQENWLLNTGLEVKEYLDVMKHVNPAECYEIEMSLGTAFLESNKHTECAGITTRLNENSPDILPELM